MREKDKIVVVGFGSQYMHLIARRLREKGYYAEIVYYKNVSREELGRENVKALVFSGGPESIYEEKAPRLPRWVLELGKPILGICYGFHLLAEMLGGRVEPGCSEYGPSMVTILESDPLFEGLGSVEKTWMSHSDCVKTPPRGARVLAVSENGYIAAFKKSVGETVVYGVQFHPEVSHTPRGGIILENFASRIAGMEKNWEPRSVLREVVEEAKRKIKSRGRVLVAISGGLDSTVTAIVLARAVGRERILPVMVDHGLLLEGEVEKAKRILREQGLELLVVDAKKRFLDALKGVRDPEEKRRIIGKIFAEIFREIAEESNDIKYLAQGTLYPDVIESGAEPGSHRIKSHHNVAGLPSSLGLEVVEPLRNLYKDEVRRIALELGLPRELVYKHPFPGPGLAVRIIGEVTEEKLRIVRKASKIVEEELKRAGLYEELWQAFPVVGEDKWIGVKGDKREEGRIVVLRIVTSSDGMTADWPRLPWSLIDKIARRIVSEVRGVTMVAYAVTTKPPATIEPQ